MSQSVVAAGCLALPCQARAALAKGRKAPGNMCTDFCMAGKLFMPTTGHG